MSKTRKYGLFFLSLLFMLSMALYVSYSLSNGNRSAFAAETTEVIEMVEGASVRVEAPSGIRFTARVDETYLENGQVKEGYEVGMLIIPSALLGEDELTAGTANVSKTVASVFDTVDNQKEGMATFNVALCDITETHYATELSARAYIYNKDTGKYIYSALNEIQERSVAQVASLALAGGDSDESGILTNYIDKCNPTLTVGGNGADEINLTLKVGDTVSVETTPASLVPAFVCESNAVTCEDKTITVESEFDNVVIVTVKLGSVTKTVNVQVEKVNIEIGGVSQLYTTDKDLGDGKKYVKTAAYTATVSVNGVDEPDADIVWSAEGDAVSIDASSGIVTAVKAGTANIYASYTYAETQTTYTSAAFEITVTKPVVDRTSTVELLMGKDDEQNPLSASEVFVDGESVIQTVYDVTTADATSVTYADGYVTAGLVEGDRILEIGNSEYSVRVKAEVVTNVIREAEDLKLFKFTTGTEIYSGTYVLANDIDASLYTHHRQSWGSAGDYGGDYGYLGLRGTFDGRGHTISGITLQRGGLFGSIGAGGTVKNVAFTDVKFYNEDNMFVLANYASALSTVQDVFISIESWPAGDHVCASLMGLTRYNHGGDGIDGNPKFIRVVVVTPDDGGKTKCGSLMSEQSNANNIRGDFTDVYVISPVKLTILKDTITGVKRYDTPAKFKEANNDLSSFSADIWDLSGDYPVFK